MSNVIDYIRDPVTGLWKAPGRAPLGGRSSLVGGTYIPDAATTGPTVSLTDMYSSTGATLTATKGLGAGYISLPSGTYEGLRIWAQIRTSSAGVVLRDCELVGQDPATIDAGGTLTGIVRNYVAGAQHIVFEDCRFTEIPWTYDHPGRPLAPGTVRTTSPLSAGVHGGNFTMRRCEVTGVQDGVNYVQNGWVVGSTVSNCLIEQSWIHALPYINNWTGTGSPSNHQTHNDCFQPNNGKNFVIRYNMLGGWRDQPGYDPWPGGSNTGDDAFSSILQLQQEVNDTQAERLENFTLDSNWIWGGQYGINMYWRSRNPSQDFSTFTITNNKFLQRPAGIRWGPSLNDPDPAINPATMNGNYFNKSPNAVPTISGNRIVDPNTLADLGAVPIANAGNGA